ncbi:hypothetical protein RINTHM_6280 [Richelia intracellularis HM01]|nr:hypothetical protein RINTHM_6280 [Richelia intracellularis HM01]
MNGPQSYPILNLLKPTQLSKEGIQSNNGISLLIDIVKPLT